MRNLRAATAAVVLLLPARAVAGTLVLSPLLTGEGIDGRERLAVHQLLGSELDLAPEIDDLEMLDVAPPTLDSACLESARCLGRMAMANGGDSLIAGRMRQEDGTSTFTLDLVLYENGAIARKVHAVVPTDSTALATAITPVVRELLVGPAPVAPAAPTSDGDVAALITFGGSAADISAEEIDELIQFAPPPVVAATAAPPPVVAPTAAAVTTAVEGIPAAMAGPVEVQAEIERPPPTSPTGAPVPTLFQVTARGGYSRYYTFDFATVGGELGVRLFRGLHAVGGVETYAVKRQLTEQEQIETGLASEWNYIFPLNGGFLYEFPFGRWEPYVGADLIAVQYYKDEIGADWAGGARFRGGVDVMLTEHFGLNVNLAAGFWTGANWIYIEEGLEETGFLPQISGGALVAF